ncbi:MAG: TetR family transcriptional regulator [Ilumatobacteraceae bacterium]
MPREEAERRLIEATIELAGEQTRLSELTTRLIADRAELNIAHINRYFGSREELLVRVAQRLAEEVAETIATLSLPEIFSLFQSDRRVLLRTRILSHLIGDGVQPSRFEVMPQIVDRFARRFAADLGISDRTSRAFLLTMLGAAHGASLFSEAYGATTQDRVDGRELALSHALSLPEVERRLGWAD